MARSTFDAAIFSEKARKDLLSLLESVPGKKNLVIQQSLVGRIELIVKFSALQEHGVDRIFLLERDNVDSSQKNVLFLVYGESPKQIRSVTSQIKRLQQNGQISHDFSIFWVPRRTLLSDTILEEAGILGEINTGDFKLLFQPLENDLLSLELDDAFGDLYLRKDPTTLFTASCALMAVQEIYGLFPRLLGKGDNASRLINLILKMRNEYATINDSSINAVPTKVSMPSSDIDALIVIDRDTDFSSALLTQLTYEGLIDESFSITHSQAELDTSITGTTANLSGDSQNSSSHQQHLKRKIRLDSSDKLYSSLRDASFAIVGSLLNRVARRLQSDYSDRHGQKSVGELKDFVAKLPSYQAEHQSLKIHTSLTEEILKITRTDMFRKALEVQQNLIAGAEASSVNEMIEDLIACDVPISTVLRLLCLESVVHGGIKQKDYDSRRRQLVQSYGYQHMLTLDALEKMELLYPKTGATTFSIPSAASSSGTGHSTNYASIRRPLQLIMDEVSEQDPDDVAYVYSGYAPLSVRIVQCILQKPYVTKLRNTGAGLTSTAATDASQGWRGFDDLLRNVKGKTVDETQSSSNKATRAKQVLEGRGGKKTTVIFFLGGITFAEVAALRFIAKQEEERRRIVICTTSIVSGEKMMRAALEFGQPSKTN